MHCICLTDEANGFDVGENNITATTDVKCTHFDKCFMLTTK